MKTEYHLQIAGNIKSDRSRGVNHIKDGEIEKKCQNPRAENYYE